MIDTLARYLAGFTNSQYQQAVRPPMRAVIDRLSTQALTSSGLVINAGGAAFPKIGAAAFFACVKGKLVTIAAGTAMPALTGVAVSAGYFNVVCFLVDVNGNMTAAAGNQAATLAGVGWPPNVEGNALIGFLIITYASPFVGGTTPLDTATTVYVSPLGAFDPTALTGY